MKDTTLKELQEDFENLLSLAVEVKKDNTDKFMTDYRERVSGLVSKYFDVNDWDD